MCLCLTFLFHSLLFPCQKALLGVSETIRAFHLFFRLRCLTSSAAALSNPRLFFCLFLSDLPSSPRAAPAVPGWCVAGKAAAPSSATTASRPGIPTRPATRPANRGRNPCTPTATTHPATHRSRDQVRS